MLINIVFFSLQLAILYEQLDLAKAMVGPTVVPVEQGQFSYVVSIASINQCNGQQIIQHKCTGTLITGQDVLTVAHCLTGEMLNSIKVIAENVQLSLGTTHTIFWWMTYNEWASQMQVDLIFPDNEIAILRLQLPILNICIPSFWNTTEQELYGVAASTAGWSYNQDGFLNEFLLTTPLLIISKYECNQRFEVLTGQQNTVDLRGTCTVMSPHVVLDKGDQGGPLIYQGNLLAMNIGSCPVEQPMDDGYYINIHLDLEFYKIFINHIISFF